MSKKYSIFITALFCLFIFGFGAAHFILPDRDFSEQENTFLEQFRAPTDRKSTRLNSSHIH